jgi:hypothetical protein
MLEQVADRAQAELRELLGERWADTREALNAALQPLRPRKGPRARPVWRLCERGESGRKVSAQGAAEYRSGTRTLGGFGGILLVAGVRWSFQGKDAGSAKAVQPWGD